MKNTVGSPWLRLIARKAQVTFMEKQRKFKKNFKETNT